MHFVGGRYDEPYLYLGVTYASLLHEVPHQARHSGSESDHDEEWKASDSRDVWRVWHEAVPDWEGLAGYTRPSRLLGRSSLSWLLLSVSRAGLKGPRDTAKMGHSS